jgi:hypothetical protein
MHETSPAIFEAKRRARDYWDIDGLPALLAGAATVLLGVMLLPTDRQPPRWVAALMLGLWASWFLFFSIRKKILVWLKSRITYPRTGYVAPPQADPDAERAPYTIISIIKEPEAEEPLAPVEGRASRKALEFDDFPPSLVILALLFANHGWLVSLACLAAALSFWWRNKKDPPWFEIAGSVIAGLVILPVDGPHRFSVFLLVFGATGMVKGATLFIRYLRQHPAPQA